MASVLDGLFDYPKPDSDWLSKLNGGTTGGTKSTAGTVLNQKKPKPSGSVFPMRQTYNPNYGGEWNTIGGRVVPTNLPGPRTPRNLPPVNNGMNTGQMGSQFPLFPYQGINPLGQPPQPTFNQLQQQGVPPTMYQQFNSPAGSVYDQYAKSPVRQDLWPYVYQPGADQFFDPVRAYQEQLAGTGPLYPALTLPNNSNQGDQSGYGYPSYPQTSWNSGGYTPATSRSSNWLSHLATWRI